MTEVSGMGAAVEPAGPVPLGTGYRPHLDGIRAVAVYLVVLFHAGIEQASGGFIGVDVFFVLSGYLVTQLLVRDLAGQGRVDLRRFYSRRVRRLLPAALVVLSVTAVVFGAIAAPAELDGAADSMRSAALYFSNWFFVAEASDYFARDVDASPVLHFWSLSVEEQFYVTWPLVLIVVDRLARRGGSLRWAITSAVVVTGALLSAGGALWLARTDSTRAYYGTDTRAYQLLLGALLALSPAVLTRLRERWLLRRHASGVAAASFAALLLLGTDLVSLGPVSRGLAAAVFTALLIVATELGERSLVRRALSAPIVAWLGRISYGTYLWHWLVILIATRVAGAGPVSTAVIGVVVATGLAALSAELIEQPVRASAALDRRRTSVVLVGIGASVVVGLVGVSVALNDVEGSGSTVVAQGTAHGSVRVPADLDWQGAQKDLAPFPECRPSDLDRCTLVHGAGAHILLIGDSHARMFIPMLEAVARSHELSFSAAVAPVCPWQDGLQYYLRVEECRLHQAEWYPAVIDGLDPDVVVLAHRTFDDPANGVRLLQEDLGELRLGTPEAIAEIRSSSAETLARFTGAGRTAIIIEPVPVAAKGADPLVCLSGATFVDACRFVAAPEPTPVERVYRSLARADPAVWSLDLDHAVCPYLPICDPIIDGLIVRRDETHLTTRFATTLRTTFEAFLGDVGIIGGGTA